MSDAKISTQPTFKITSHINSITHSLSQDKVSGLKQKFAIKQAQTQADLQKLRQQNQLAFQQKYKSAKQFLEIRSEVRQQFEIDELSNCLQHLTFFQQYIQDGNKEIVRKCSQYFELQKKDKDDLIQEYGQRATHFYIVLTGQVQTFTLQTIQNIQNTPNVAQQSNNVSQILSQQMTNADKQTTPNTTKLPLIQNQQPTDKLKPSHILQFGDQLNELSLLETQESIIQAVALTPCELVALTRKHYVQVLKDIEQEKLDSNLSFFKMTSYFENWSDSNIKNLYVNTRVIEFQQNQVVYKEGSQANCVYLVKEGTFIKVKNKSSQYNQQTSNQSQVTKEIVNSYNLDNSEKVEMFEMIGAYEIIHKMPRTESVYCFSQYGKLLEISKSYFLLYLLSDPKFKFRIIDNAICNQVNGKNKKFTFQENHPMGVNVQYLKLIEKISKNVSEELDDKAFLNTTITKAKNYFSDQLKMKDILDKNKSIQDQYNNQKQILQSQFKQEDQNRKFKKANIKQIKDKIQKDGTQISRKVTEERINYYNNKIKTILFKLQSERQDNRDDLEAERRSGKRRSSNKMQSPKQSEEQNLNSQDSTFQQGKEIDLNSPKPLTQDNKNSNILISNEDEIKAANNKYQANTVTKPLYMTQQCGFKQDNKDFLSQQISPIKSTLFFNEDQYPKPNVYQLINQQTRQALTPSLQYSQIKNYFDQYNSNNLKFNQTQQLVKSFCRDSQIHKSGNFF